MKNKSLTTLGLAILATSVLSLTSARASTLTLNFSSAGGTILDTNGVGTGFTARMPDTGANITNNDPNLNLNTAGGVLQMLTSPGADFNGQTAMADATVVGINLASLGFTGGNDFSVTAAFINITNLLLQPDQLCLVVGTEPTNMIRAGFINFSNFHTPGTDANEGFGVNTVGNFDIGGRFFGSVVGSTMTVNIKRTSGTWAVTVNGIDRMPNTQGNGTGTPLPPTFLDTETNLFVGVVALDVFNDSPWFVNLNTFTVVVSGNSPPSIASQTPKAIVEEGNPTSLSVTINDSTKTPVSYQWRQNGVPVPGQTNDTMSIFALAANAGNYTVVITNSLGSITSAPAPLSVILPSGSLKLNFAAAGGGVQDINGVGTGFPDRLPGTGTAFVGSDTNLFLDTNNTVLNITSTSGDYNLGANEPMNESLGVTLTRLGFTGSEDLNASLIFPTLPPTVSFDQAGVYVGIDTNNITRAGWIDFTQFSSPRGKEQYSENVTLNTGTGVPNNGPGGHYFGFVFDPAILPCTVHISRTSGTWHHYIDGAQWDLFTQPTFLNGTSNLTAGIFIYDTGGGAYTQAVSNFTARVFSGIKVNAAKTGGNLTIGWNVAGPVTLQSNTNLLNPGGWTTVGTFTNSPFSIPVPTSGQKFYRLSL
jgi:hypothetical protein